jgi:hypothetical protein
VSQTREQFTKTSNTICDSLFRAQKRMRLRRRPDDALEQQHQQQQLME